VWNTRDERKQILSSLLFITPSFQKTAYIKWGKLDPPVLFPVFNSTRFLRTQNPHGDYIEISFPGEYNPRNTIQNLGNSFTLIRIRFSTLWLAVQSKVHKGWMDGEFAISSEVQLSFWGSLSKYTRLWMIELLRQEGLR